MLEDLKALLDGAHGEAIDVPHPATMKNTEMTAMTKWYRSELPTDFETNMLGGVIMVESDGDPDYGKPLSYVKGMISREVVLDAYNEPVGDPKYVVLTKVDNPKMKNKDIASELIRASSARELRRRFRRVFTEFETNMQRAKTPLPIALLDDVPFHVVQILITKGCKTVNDFANYSEPLMDALRVTLEAYKLHARVAYLDSYREKARDKIGWVAPKQKAAA